MLALSSFVKREGHARVPQNWVENGVKLGAWVMNMRKRRGQLSKEREERINELGLLWDPRANQDEEKMVAVEKYHRREGHLRVPKSWIEDGHRIGNFVSVLRSRRNSLSKAHLARLAKMGFQWDPFEERFELGMSALRSFISREGHSEVPRKHIENGFRLGEWFSNRKTEKRLGRLDPKRLKALLDCGAKL